MKVTIEKILARLTGLSTPVFGVSWTPPELDRSVAERVITFLEDRRVIFPDAILDNAFVAPHIATQSLIEIRRYVTLEMQKLGRESELFGNLEGIRAACRRCIDKIGIVDEDHPGMLVKRGHTSFISAFVELRITIGFHLACIAVKYGIELNEELLAILPPDDSSVD
jgi:hypothetical protein